MSDIKKIKRTAIGVFFVVCAIIIYHLIMNTLSIWVILSHDLMPMFNVQIIILLITLIVISFYSWFISLMLLLAIKKDETPFNLKNVKRLKIIAIVLVIYEPIFIILNQIQYRHYEIQHESGIMFTGLLMTAGLIVYCVALVFQYGISLQNQVDETL